MTPLPPSSPDGSSLPPRHRPNMGNLAKDTTELDLWAFDDVELPETPAPEAPSAETPAPGPKPIEKLKARQIKSSGAPKSSKNHEGIQTNVSRVRPKPSPGSASSGASKVGSDFDDLDHWEDNTPALELEEIPELDTPQPEKSIEPAPPASAPPSAATTQETVGADEFSPAPPGNALPAFSRPRLNLTKIEKVGLLALLSILVFGAGFTVIFSLNRLPTESAWGNTNHFPIKGQSIKILSAESYWRAPILEGKTPDIVRRGTVLLPVLNLTTSDGAAAIRVIFRKNDGESIGDIVTRKVQGGQKLEIAATAGFDDIGMHSAYRTGESKPWIIEVFEAPTVDSPNAAFKKLFEMKISTDRR